MRRFIFMLLGAIVGGAVGASIALLYTPASGETLRGHVRDAANNLQLQVKQAALDKRVELESQLAAMRAPAPKAE